MEVAIGRDWLDYVQALGGIVGVLIAVVAAWFAATSARDAARSSESARRTADAAERTADAAEETAASSKLEAEHSQKLLEQVQIQLELQQEEHAVLMAESKRQPKVRPVLSMEKMETSAAGPTSVFFQFGGGNDGSKTAEQALLLLLTPRTVELASCNLDGSNPKSILPTDQDYTLEANGEQVLSHSLNKTRDLRPNISELEGARLTFTKPGHYEIRLKVTHHSIEGGSLQVEETITIPTVAPS